HHNQHEKKKVGFNKRSYRRVAGHNRNNTLKYSPAQTSPKRMAAWPAVGLNSLTGEIGSWRPRLLMLRKGPGSPPPRSAGSSKSVMTSTRNPRLKKSCARPKRYATSPTS